MEIRLSQLIGPAFYASHQAVKAGALEIVESGGRGSGKSSYLSIEFLLQMIRHPDCHGAVLRKVGATIRTSTYTQLKWAADALGIGHLFRFTLNPLEAEYLPTGQKILFLGMDDPGKLKSLKMPFGYIGVLWFEELDQFTAEEVRSAEQSLLRGGSYSLSLKSFNPPPDPSHWANRYPLEPKPGKFCHHSTYLELPAHWLGDRFISDAAHLKQVAPILYENEYLGKAVGQGDAVFANIRMEPIDETGFERIISGVDWGWWPDPWAFNRVSYDSRNRTLYIFDEVSRHRTSNRDTAALVKERTAPGEIIAADSAEQKSVADYRSYGLSCRAVEKGQGSVQYSMKWLQSLDAIVIDPDRCPETAKEFLSYQYRDGAYPDKNNHHIDAVRYATSTLWHRGQ